LQEKNTKIESLAAQVADLTQQVQMQEQLKKYLNQSREAYAALVADLHLLQSLEDMVSQLAEAYHNRKFLHSSIFYINHHFLQLKRRRRGLLPIQRIRFKSSVFLR
jgi:DNA repair exonuclease SbcCD ATPase subunit